MVSKSERRAARAARGDDRFKYCIRKHVIAFNAKFCPACGTQCFIILSWVPELWVNPDVKDVWEAERKREEEEKANGESNVETQLQSESNTETKEKETASAESKVTNAE